MVSGKSTDIVKELEIFLQELKDYQYYRLLAANNEATRKQIANAANLRDKLLRDAGRFRSLIAELTGEEKVKVTRLKNGREYEYDLWFTGLQQLFNLRAAEAISYCIDVTSATIGRLEDDIEKGKRDKETGELIEKPNISKTNKKPLGEKEMPVYLFDNLKLHPKVVEVSRPLFKDGHYKSAILEAYIALNNLVKDKTGMNLDGKALMSKVFSENKPIIKLNDLLDRSDFDEQEGFKFLYMGAIVGIRNPKAHDNIIQSDPYRTLEYLGFVSLLMKRVDEGKVVRLEKDKDKP